jgi:hypothetical protein
MRLSMKLSYGLLVVAVLCTALAADIGPTPGTQRVGPIFERADLVCNCAVESINVVNEEHLQRQGKLLIRRHMIASVEVQDAYKSSVSVAQRISVEYDEETPATMASMPGLTSGEKALLFLAARGPSAYVFADPFLGVTPFSALGRQPGELGMMKLQSALAGALLGTSRDDQINAMRLLQGFEELSPDTISRVIPLSSSADPGVAFSAIAVLLKTKTPEAVETLERYLDKYKSDTEPIALASIGTELGQISDEGALAAIDALTRSRYLPIRFGAMEALRRMRNPRSAPALVRRLDDAESTVRYVAVITLSEIFGQAGDYAPSMYLFDKNPDFYVNLWKAWWAKEGRALQE